MIPPSSALSWVTAAEKVTGKRMTSVTVTKLVVAPIINLQVASGLMSFAGSLSGVIAG